MSTMGNRISEIRKRLGLRQEEFAETFQVSRAFISAIEKDRSKFSVDNLIRLQSDYNVNINYILSGIGEPFYETYTLDRQNDTTIPQKVENFGRRMTELQDKHEYLDKDMAKILRISEEEYIDLKLGDAEPDFNVLVRLKQCFKVSIDWLLFGD